MRSVGGGSMSQQWSMENMTKYLNSYDIYKKICSKGHKYDQETKRNSNSSFSAGITISEKPDFEQAYFDIIKTLLYEVTTHKKSDLLSLFCKATNMNFNFTYLNNIHPPANVGSNYDYLPIILGLKMMMQGEIETNIYSKGYLLHDRYIFRGYDFTHENEQQKLSEIMVQLKFLDGLLGDRISNKNNPVQSSTMSINAVSSRDFTTLEESEISVVNKQRKEHLVEELKLLSSTKKEADEKIFSKITELHSRLQEELTIISSLREEIKYEYSKESISQLIMIFNLISDVYDHHSKTRTTSQNYKVLIDNCVEFLEAIKYALEYLGVNAIEKEQIVFDPKIHESEGVVKPGFTVTKVNRIGFIHNSRVLQKARVAVQH